MAESRAKRASGTLITSGGEQHEREAEEVDAGRMMIHGLVRLVMEERSGRGL